MSRIRTRGQLLARVKLYQQAAAMDSSQDVLTRQFLDHAVGRVYTFLAAGNVGFLQTRRTYTMSAATELLDLPANFESLLAMRLTDGAGACLPTSTPCEA